jgi:hypothetical protein
MERRSAVRIVLAQQTRALLVLCAFVGGAAAQGRIVVNHDEWTLSTTGFASAPAGATATFVQNFALWLNGGVPGNFLVNSGNFGLPAGPLQAAMIAGGHTLTYWSSALGIAQTAAGWAAYDGVLFAGPIPGAAPNVAAEIVAYVQAGGGVYLGAGTGSFGGAGTEAAYWNPFLNVFGMNYGAPFNGVGGVLPTAYPHPIFVGVPSLYYNNGNPVTATGSVPGVTIFGNANAPGLFGIYEGGPALYQTNRPQASLLIDGLAGTAYAAPPAGGPTGTLNFASTLVGAPWDVALTIPDPILAVGAGGFALSDGQIVNLAVGSPGFLFAFGGFGGGGFPGAFNLPYSVTAGSVPLSAQLIVLDAAAPLGLHLSAPVRIQP